MASLLSNRAKREFLKGNIPWESGSFKVLLVAPAYTPDPDHNFVSQLSANELSGTGYQAGFSGTGRQALAGMSVTQDDTNNRAEATATPTLFSGINAGTIGYAVIYKVGTSDADSIIIATIDVPDTTTNGTDITINWLVAASGGIFYI